MQGLCVIAVKGPELHMQVVCTQSFSTRCMNFKPIILYFNIFQLSAVSVSHQLA